MVYQLPKLTEDLFNAVLLRLLLSDCNMMRSCHTLSSRDGAGNRGGADISPERSAGSRVEWSTHPRNVLEVRTRRLRALLRVCGHAGCPRADAMSWTGPSSM